MVDRTLVGGSGKWIASGAGHDNRRTRLNERACYSRYFENVKSCAFWGTWQLKHCFTESVAIGFVGSPPAHAWNPHPPVDAYFLESFTMSVMALRVAPCTKRPAA